MGRRRSRTLRFPLPGFSQVCFVAVIFLNIAVFLYHGDPRDAQAASPAPAPIKKASASLAKPDNVNQNPQESSSVREDADLELPAEELVGPPAFLAESYNILAGVRSTSNYASVVKASLKPNQTPAGALYEAGLIHSDVTGILSSIGPYVDFRRLRPGNYFKLFFDADHELQSVELYRSVLEQTRAVRTTTGWEGKRIEIPVQTMNAAVSGTVDSSLWVALKGAGEAAELINLFVDVFAWDIDFYSEVFPGDTFRVLVEKRYAHGEHIGYGPIEAAEFVSNGNVFRAYMHQERNGSVGYYDEKGQSMQKQLLKSPLKYGHVTSRFGKRRHPVLGYTRNHNGIDYGVGTGTPTWSVGAGKVVRAGYHGGYGKLVEIRHANGWLSQYAHLSKISVRVGQRVTQKQIIGKTGSTGMSTGPHLHYGLKRHGAYVNPLAQKFSRGKSLKGEELARYKASLKTLDGRLTAMTSVSDS
ncbi:MAG: M23 family metallopeptidase [Myxococcota bacterium]|nr:M23 family metallopeptidase [Myxococcota bacterium]